jgi:DNA-binding NarL/FixJ family response regulator
MKRRTDNALTKREREVTTAIAEGKNNHEIAHELGISAKTVDTHRSNALARIGCAGLGVRGDVMLTRHALREGWVTL